MFDYLPGIITTLLAVGGISLVAAFVFRRVVPTNM